MTTTRWRSDGGGFGCKDPTRVTQAEQRGLGIGRQGATEAAKGEG